MIEVSERIRIEYLLKLGDKEAIVYEVDREFEECVLSGLQAVYSVTDWVFVKYVSEFIIDKYSASGELRDGL